MTIIVKPKVYYGSNLTNSCNDTLQKIQLTEKIPGCHGKVVDHCAMLLSPWENCRQYYSFTLRRGVN